ncbi:hypothetical protein [uncultured Phenylobacterium sp.]|uniref:hypothetical protein n=1 Tax=uncultured Phenylobacterium sp. TaxID=349273 RepID=UPI0025D11E5D|nr:hypothetical protein [uncultured Phenylobacterium sp.]
MQTSDHYRAKAAEMLRLAETAAGPHMRNHWSSMAAQWTGLAERMEAEGRARRAETRGERVG